MILSPLSCFLNQRLKYWSVRRHFDLSRMQVVVLVMSFLLARAVYIQGDKPNREAQRDTPCRDPKKEIDSNDVALHDNEKKGDDTGPSSPTGQRVAGHLLAVLLLASVAAAIIEAVRARMAHCKSSPKSGDGKDSDHTPVHGAQGKAPRRTEEKSVDVNAPRSSSAGAAKEATSRAQKALRARLLGGRPLPLSNKAVPPLLRRSSFPVMSRGSGKDSNNSSPIILSRKQSIDLGDDDLGDFQKRRVRIIRRF